MAAVPHPYSEDLTLRSYTDLPQWNPVTTTNIPYTDFTVSTKYLIVASGRFGGNTTTANTGMDVSDNDGDIFTVDPDTRSGMFAHQVYTATTGLRDYFYVGAFTTKASGLTGNLFMRSYHDGQFDTSYADQMSLLAIDLDDLGAGNYTEDSDYTGYTDIGATWEDLVEVTGLSSGKTYLVLGSVRLLAGTSGQNIEARLIDSSSTIHAYHGTQSRGFEGHVIGVQGVVTGRTSAKIQAQAGTDWDLLQGYLIAIDVSAFADFDYGFSATGAGISTTDEELAAVTSIASRTSSDHLFVGRYNYTTGGNDAQIAGTVKTGTSYGAGTETRAGDINVYGTQQPSATSGEQVTVMAVQAFTGGASNNLYLGGGRVTSPNPTSQYEMVAVLNLEKGSSLVEPTTGLEGSGTVTVVLSNEPGAQFTFRPDGDGTTTGVFNELGTTTNLYQSIDDDPDTPTVTDYVFTKGVSGQSFHDLTATPSDFTNMVSLTVRAHVVVVNPAGTIGWLAQIFASDEITPYTNEVLVATEVSDGLVTGGFTINSAGLLAGKTDWDAARVRLRWNYI